MISTLIKRILLISAITVSVTLLLHSCANRGAGPQGGIRDTTPPQLLKSSQSNKATSATNQRLEWIFDENIQLEKQQENILVSPPQKQAPTIRAMGKKLSVAFADSLASNTTYTIDFGNAVVDLNEKNALANFSWSFATGATIDTMQLAGYVIDARTLTPYEGIIVGVYKSNKDSAFVSTPFDYMARTNSQGFFTIRNIPQVPYQVYALKDIPQAFYYDQKGKEIGFFSQKVTPEEVKHLQTDTIWNDNDTVSILRIDTSYSISYAPNDLLIKLFREERAMIPTLRRALRPSKESFTLLMSAALDKEPLITPINVETSKWLKREQTNRMDSLVYWITDSNALALDTIQFTVSYASADSLKTDTIALTYKQPRARTANEKTLQQLEIVSLTKSPVDIADTLRLQVKEPMKSLNIEKMHLTMRIDTTWHNVPFSLQYDDDNCKKKISVLFDRKERANYRLVIDSAAIVSDYGKQNTSFVQTFTTKSPDDYASLMIEWKNIPPYGIVELLDAKETVVRAVHVSEPTTVLRLLSPGNYFLRLVLDANQNGKWDTGSVLPKLEPEEVYYYPKRLVLRANWDSVEEWDYTAIPLLQQRATELPKSKK
ncbi:MAG TPA: Ig-like domain-containing protein [Paludibacteraceae bacterium]|nr:Ig-like domain-containing protein [Paludibacteraceae bacterium]